MSTPTIADAIRNENRRLVDAMMRDRMNDCGNLRDYANGDIEPGTVYLWLGGFDRFCKVGSVNVADWWVYEPGAYGSSWSCTPDTRIYRKVD